MPADKGETPERPTMHDIIPESGPMILETVPVREATQAQHDLRPLSSFEELLWQMDKRSPLHGTLAAHVDGETTVKQWKDALEQTRCRHPLWSTVIVATKDGASVFQKMHDAHVSLRLVEGEFTQNWELEIARERCQPVDATRGPLVRAVLLHTEASCMLILSAHHSICDGMSLAFAIRDVLQALSGRSLKKLALHRSQEETLGMCSQPRGQMRDQMLHPTSTARPTAYPSNSLLPPEVRSLQLSATFADTLRNRARQEKTTVLAALMAAAGIVARRTPGYGTGRDLHLCSTISNRAMMSFPEDSGVLFTACKFPLAEYRVLDFWSLAREAKETLRTMQHEDGVKAVLDAVDGIVRSGLGDDAIGDLGGSAFLFDIHLSNLGVVPIPTSYRAIALRQLWGPAVLNGFEGEQTLGISTVNGRLCLLHTSRSPLADFLGQIESILHSVSIS
jgi:hypothetical protein